MDKYLPSSSATFKYVFGIHLISVVWNLIHDCDETFNYWEPLHFLINKSGFQTWEYSPLYALRSYGFLWIYGFPAILARWLFGINNTLLFYLTRIYMALMASVVETYLYGVLTRRIRDAPLGFLTVLLLCGSAGSFIASTGFLPSSFAMHLSTAMLAAWIDMNYKLAVSCVAISSIAGWPFAAALGIPLAFDMLFIRHIPKRFFQYSCVSGVVCTVPLVIIDSLYFGHFVVAPLNILKYNVFSEHGSELYGTESFLFYIKNYFLNFNLAFPLCLAAPGVMFLTSVFEKKVKQQMKHLLLYISPFYLWNAIFFLQPHKEERFLFPVYPFLTLGGALCLCHIVSIVSYIFRLKHKLGTLVSRMFVSLVVLVCFLISLLRILALVQAYNAPFAIYNLFSQPEFQTTGKPVNVCTGREWHRFPSSFLLGRDHNSIQLKFIQSEFRGQLPGEYDNRWNNATRLPSPHFNDANREETSRYWPVAYCDYLVDRDEVVETLREPRYSRKPEWTVVASRQFLDAERSPVLYRAFYVPFLFSKNNHFVRYLLLKRRQLRAK